MPERVIVWWNRLRNTGAAAPLPPDCERNASSVDFQSGQRRCLRSCKYLHERNYDELGNMRSSAPGTSVWRLVRGVWSRVPVVDCA